MEAEIKRLSELLRPRLQALLKPNGFGEVTLKVVVQDGQVKTVSVGDSSVHKLG